MRTNYNDAFGRMIQEWCSHENVSAYEVSRRSRGRISHQTVRNAMTGAVPSSDLIVELARALERDPNVLLTMVGSDLRWIGPEDGEDKTRRVIRGRHCGFAAAMPAAA